jgi:predicted acyl esterase
MASFITYANAYIRIPQPSLLYQIIEFPRSPLKITTLMTSSQPIVEPSNTIHRFINIGTPMRNSVNLSSDIILPAGTGPFPTILMRTPYDNSDARYRSFGRYFAQRGYAFVVQDRRGCGDSGGKRLPFMNDTKNGYDIIEWIAAQPFPPHLAAMSSTASPGRWFDDCMIPTIFNYEHMLSQSPAKDHQYIVVGPWDHHGTREPWRKIYGEDFGDAATDVLDLQCRFFDRYLKAVDFLSSPKLVYLPWAKIGGAVSHLGHFQNPK